MTRNQFKKFGMEDHVTSAVSRLGFTVPTPVQEKVIPLMMQGRNVLVEAATGTGKTAAYGLPLISRINLLKRSTQVLVVVPSRELATQVLLALRSFSVNPKLRVDALFGGMTLAESERKIKASPHILIAVPGRLKDVLRSGRFDFFWRDIRHLVLDEADKLVEAGFQELMDSLLPNLRNTAHTALFSATLSKDAHDLVAVRFSPLTEVKLSAAEATRNISFYSVPAPRGAKERTLRALITQQQISHALIFCSHRKEVMPVAQYLRTAGLRAEAYHGMLDQTEREAVMRRFRLGMVQFLVATDLAARGLDVEELPAVIHYSWPDSLEVFMHRSGRTGRAGNHGDCYALSSSQVDEANLIYFQREARIRIKPLPVKVEEGEAAATAPGDKWVKMHFNRGKRDKVRLGDIVGLLTGQFGAEISAVGTIALYPDHALVDVTQDLARMLEAETALRIKGMGFKATRFTLDDRKRVEKGLRKKQVGVRDKQQVADRKEKAQLKRALKTEAAVTKPRSEKPRTEKKKSAGRPQNAKSGKKRR